MAKGYKIRLEDGSEIGPMDLQAVKDWYTQGLIGKDSMVLLPATTRWRPLREAISLNDAGARAAGAAAAKPAVRSAPAPATRPPARARRPAPARRGVPGWLIGVVALAVVGAAGGVVAYRWLAAESPAAQSIRQWAAPERRFTDAGHGVTIEVPSGWTVLRPEQTLVKTPLPAKLVLAQPRLGGFGFLTGEPPPRGAYSLDEYLDFVLATRRKAEPSLRETGRSDARVGTLAGRAASAEWDSGGSRQRDVTLVARDGWSYVGLIAWVPSEASSGARALESLRAGLALAGAMAAHLDEAVQTAVREDPHLSPAAAEIVMAQSEAKVLEPQETFRRAYELASRGLPTIKPAEARELGSLVGAASSALSSRDRDRLMAYFERVRDRRLTTLEEDREMARLMKSGVLKLSPPRLARLQALYEKAIRGAVAGRPPA